MGLAVSITMSIDIIALVFVSEGISKLQLLYLFCQADQGLS
jgi:hypothetical protein